MRRHLVVASVTLGFLAAASTAIAQSVETASHRRPVYVVPTQPCPPPVILPSTPTDPKVTDPKTPDPKLPPDAQPGAPSTDAFSQGPPAGGAESVGFNPAMFGDIIGSPSVLTTVRLGRGATVAARVPVISRGGFKVADNGSPRPVDRVFFLYNYYDNVDTSFANRSNPPFNLHRETIGFEKTFFEGNGSLGLRLPFLQLEGAFGDIDATQLGDLTIVIKWAFLNDLMTGNVISGGLAVTAPTGEAYTSITGETVHSTLFQPWGGFIWNFGDAYVHGFSAIVIPSDSRDATLWFNDVGVGYYLYRSDRRDRFVTAIVPTLEAHLTTPLNHRGDSDRGGVPDWLTMTAGVNFVLGGNSTLGCALGVPVTGPRPFDMEALVSFNFRF